MVNKTISLNNVEAEIETHEGAKNRMTVKGIAMRAAVTATRRLSNDESSSNSDSTEYCYAVNNKQKHPRTSVSINGQSVRRQLTPDLV